MSKKAKVKQKAKQRNRLSFAKAKRRLTSWEIQNQRIKTKENPLNGRNLFSTI